MINDRIWLENLGRINELGFLRVCSICPADGVTDFALCGTCGAMVWIGNMFEENNDFTSIKLHKAWHQKQGE